VSSAIPHGRLSFAGIGRGIGAAGAAGVSLGVLRLPTDSIGVFSLTLTNIVVGSAVQIESQDGLSILVNTVAASAEKSFNLPVYAIGSPFNDLRIKVRKGSAAPYYRPFETLTTAIVGSQSIYVAQIKDD